MKSHHLLVTSLLFQSLITVNAEQTEKITVFAPTPLSSNLSVNKNIIGSVQYISDEQLSRAQATSLADHLRNQLVSLHINDVQNNPFQPEVQYRGFTASPLLGLPQGISVYLNGVRFNEPFGDTVNWDLIPLAALDNVALFSGSNPAFGQNTLGGALALKTKNGFSYDKNEMELRLGSFGQKQYSIQSGGHKDKLGYYIIANRYQEDGWRDFSDSEINQVLANISYIDDNHSIELMVASNDNTMTGNGAVPEELVELEGRESVYTHPDETNNRLDLITLSADINLSDQLSLQSNAYYRKNKVDSLNGDDSDYEECDIGAGYTLCEEEDDEVEVVEFIGYDDDTLLSDISELDPDDIDGTLNTGATDNESYGVALQLVYNQSFDTFSHEFVFGLGGDRANINFESDTEFAILHNDSAEDDRSVSSIGLFDQESRVRLDVTTKQHYFYLSDTISFGDNLTVNLAGRYNDSQIIMHDLIDTGEGSLNGDHHFSRFNPAIGMSYQLNNQVTTKLSYSESSRNPSPAELSCADEDDPCKLPNGFVADPPLEQVVAKTIEASIGYNNGKHAINATVFSTKSVDDIIFQQAGSTPSRGYFVNVDETRRQGIELSLSSASPELAWGASYNYLDATFESPFVSFSPVNPLGANRQVEAGDTIPGQPKHQIKLHMDWNYNDKTNVGFEFLYASSSYYRGDEANENKKVPSYALANIYANYQMTPNLRFSAKVDNLFDREYHTFGLYGEGDEVLEEFYPDGEFNYFIGPSRPRSVSVAVNYQF